MDTREINGDQQAVRPMPIYAFRSTREPATQHDLELLDRITAFLSTALPRLPESERADAVDSTVELLRTI